MQVLQDRKSKQNELSLHKRVLPNKHIYCSCIGGGGGRGEEISLCLHSCKHTEAFRYTHCPDRSGDVPNVKLNTMVSNCLLGAVFRTARTLGTPLQPPGLSPLREGAARRPRPLRSPRRQPASAGSAGRAGRAAAGRGSSGQLPARLAEAGGTTPPPVPARALGPLAQLPAPPGPYTTTSDAPPSFPAMAAWLRGQQPHKRHGRPAVPSSQGGAAAPDLPSSRSHLPTEPVFSRARPGRVHPPPARGSRGPAARGSTSSGRSAGQQPNPVSRRSV